MGDLTTDLSTLDFEGFASDFSNWVETSTVMGIPVVILGVVGLVGYLLLTRGHGKRAVSAVGSGAKKVYRTARAA